MKIESATPRDYYYGVTSENPDLMQWMRDVDHEVSKLHDFAIEAQRVVNKNAQAANHNNDILRDLIDRIDANEGGIAFCSIAICVAGLGLFTLAMLVADLDKDMETYEQRLDHMDLDVAYVKQQLKKQFPELDLKF